MARGDRAARVAKGSEGRQSTSRCTASSVSWPPAVARICYGAMHRRCLTRSYLAVGSSVDQLTDTLVENRFRAPLATWAGRDGEGRSGSKSGEGPTRGSNRFLRSAAHSHEVALAGPMAASSGPLPPSVPRIMAGRLANAHAVLRGAVERLNKLGLVRSRPSGRGSRQPCWAM
jgi:hypothetical protein